MSCLKIVKHDFCQYLYNYLHLLISFFKVKLEKRGNFMNFENSIPFDLGFGKHLHNFVADIEYAYAELNSLKNYNTKRFQFQRYFSLFKNEIDMYIDFYIGCMLWACYIKQFEGKEISGNSMLGQEMPDEEGLYTLNYIIDYLSKFEKDVKYYLGKTVKFEQKIYDLLDLYKKFLIENKQFTNTKTSSDLIVPLNIENPNYEEYLDTIQKVVETGDFSLLRSYLDLLLNSAI